ncbi:MAG: hypothetical protein IMZ61_15130 [Planctomycetes bacterium]|nr:hypothetical protein [Planctomycetota bacterium]
MLKVTSFRSRSLAGALIAAFVLLLMPLPSFSGQQPQSYARQGSLQGNVYSEGMRSRVTNAVVKLRNLNNQKEYTSQPTDAKGGYKILGVEEGWYTLGVSTAAGDFNLNYGVYVKAGETAKLSVVMLPGGMLEGKGGSGGGGKSFFKTPAGILTIVALGAGVGFGVYELTKEKEASPVR